MKKIMIIGFAVMLAGCSRDMYITPDQTKLVAIHTPTLIHYNEYNGVTVITHPKCGY